MNDDNTSRLQEQVDELMEWKKQQTIQQINYPLDKNSLDILSKYFIKFVETFDIVGVSGVEFPFAMVVNVNGTNYYLNIAGTFYIYQADKTSDLLYVNNNLFINGDAVVIYTSNQAPTPLVAGGNITYYVTNQSGNTFKLSLTLALTFTVSGITTDPTVGATYTDDRLNSFTVTAVSLSGISPNRHGTITVSGITNNSFDSGTLTKTSGTGDATIAYSAFTSTGGTAINLTSNGIGDQFIAYR